jgi:hypothetical protein
MKYLQLQLRLNSLSIDLREYHCDSDEEGIVNIPRAKIGSAMTKRPYQNLLEKTN